MSLERGKVRGTRPRETASLDPLDFALPPELEAGEPPEARGLARDEVRLMVSHRSDDRCRPHAFPRYWRAPALRISPGHQHQRHAQRRSPRRTPRWHAAGAAPLDPPTRRPLDGRAAPADRARHSPVPRRHPRRNAAPAWRRERHAADAICPRPRYALRPSPQRLWIATFALPSPLHAYLDRTASHPL